MDKSIYRDIKQVDFLLDYFSNKKELDLLVASGYRDLIGSDVLNPLIKAFFVVSLAQKILTAIVSDNVNLNLEVSLSYEYDTRKVGFTLKHNPFNDVPDEDKKIMCKIVDFFNSDIHGFELLFGVTNLEDLTRYVYEEEESFKELVVLSVISKIKNIEIDLYMSSNANVYKICNELENVFHSEIDKVLLEKDISKLSSKPLNSKKLGI